MVAQGRLGLAVAGGTGAVLVLATGCSGGGDGKGELASDQTATVTITPGNGAKAVKPDGPIEVKASDGTLKNVTVQGKGATVTGRLSADRKVWRSDRTLTPGTSYTVTAQAESGGKPTTTTATFTTLKPAKTLSVTDITPGFKGRRSASACRSCCASTAR